jgi:thiamine transporter
MFKKFLEFNSQTIAYLAILVIVGVGGIIFLNQSKNRKFTPRMIVYASVCIALSFVLSYIRLARMPQGGSITPASMLPMLLFANVFGPIPGIAAGFAYGLLQYVQDAYAVHWVQFLVDYPLAFGMLGLAGIYRKHFAVSMLIGIFGRFVMHYLSGVIFFAEFAPEGIPAALYSLTYNGTVMAVEAAICILVALLPQIRNLASHMQKSYTLNQ